MALTNQQVIAISILGIAAYASYAANSNITSQSTIGQRNQTLIDKSNAPDANLFIISTENDSKQAIQNINEVRKKAGKAPLNYSSKAYNLAVAIAKEMNQYNYFDSTNPKTHNCADKMKLGFGFTPEEYLAQSILRYVPKVADIGFESRSVSQVAKEWVEKSVNTDQNFLYPQHVAGAVGCDKNKCVFLALNYSGYGKGCGVKKN